MNRANSTAQTPVKQEDSDLFRQIYANKSCKPEKKVELLLNEFEKLCVSFFEDLEGSSDWDFQAAMLREGCEMFAYLQHKFRAVSAEKKPEEVLAHAG